LRLGLEVEGTPAFIDGEFLDTVIGIPDARTEIVMLRPPDGSTRAAPPSMLRTRRRCPRVSSRAALLRSPSGTGQRAPRSASHYAIPFVRVENLDFLAANDDKRRGDIAIKLVRRIYAIRNAVTHGKASAARYSPYTDDLYLIREVPLVRIAAEQLLIPRESRI